MTRLASGQGQMYELPTCPVCLERMDSAVTGLITVPCSHTFHCACLSKWGDSRYVHRHIFFFSKRIYVHVYSDVLSVDILRTFYLLTRRPHLRQGRSRSRIRHHPVNHRVLPALPQPISGYASSVETLAVGDTVKPMRKRTTRQRRIYTHWNSRHSACGITQATDMCIG
jgi:hypothetical protein